MLHRNLVRISEIDAELEEWKERVDIIRHKLKFVRALPEVACVEQIDPLLIAGGRIPGLVEIAGGNAVQAENGRFLLPPDIVILMLPGHSIEQGLREMDALLGAAWFLESPALKNNRVYIVDCQKYFNLPGAGMIDSVEILAEIINAADFHFGFEGEAWVKFGV